jgi:hypothetical protein
MCESLLRRTPDGPVVPGLASLPASIGDMVIEGSFAQKQAQKQATRCVRNRPVQMVWTHRSALATNR